MKMVKSNKKKKKKEHKRAMQKNSKIKVCSRTSSITWLFISQQVKAHPKRYDYDAFLPLWNIDIYPWLLITL